MSPCALAFSCEFVTGGVRRPALRVDENVIQKSGPDSSVCEKVCFKACGPLFGHCNSRCDAGNCESHVYTQKYLVKKVHITECDTYKCVPTSGCENTAVGIVA